MSDDQRGRWKREIEYHRLTSLVDMAMYERENPVRLGGLAFRIFKRGREEMVVPGEARGEWPRLWIGLIARSSIALERRREIISVTKKKVTQSLMAECVGSGQRSRTLLK